MTIGSRIFYMEEPAYAKLEAYLHRLKTHFASFEEKDEILSDIEQRLAELFAETINSTKPALTETDIERAIQIMGAPEQFEDEALAEEARPKETSTSTSTETSVNSKRFYRNPDDRVFCGVCSGIGAYVGLDSRVIRAIFVILFILGIFTHAVSAVFVGIVYLVLCLLIPEAKTVSQKIEMQGEPITVSTITKQAKTETKNAELPKSGFERLLIFIGQIFSVGISLLKRLFGFLWKIARILLGLMITLWFAGILVGLLFLLSVLLFNIQSPYVDSFVRELATGPLYYAGLTSLFFAFAIPAFTLFLGGLSLLRRKNLFTVPLISALAGLWVIAAISTGVIALDRAPAIQQAWEKQEASVVLETRTFTPTQPFTALEASGSYRLTVRPSSTVSVIARGEGEALQKIHVSSEQGILTIGKEPWRRLCLFCNHKQVEIEIGLPHALSKITLTDAVRGSVTQTTSTSLILALSDASSLQLNGSASSIQATMDGASRLTLNASSPEFTLRGNDASYVSGEDFLTERAHITLEGVARADLQLQSSSSSLLQLMMKDNTRLTIEGSAQQLEANLRDIARFDGSDLVASTSTFSLQDAARAEITATNYLKATTRDVSQLEYLGTPLKTDIQELETSRIHSDHDMRDEDRTYSDWE